MALEAVVFPQDPFRDLYSCLNQDLYYVELESHANNNHHWDYYSNHSSSPNSNHSSSPDEIPPTPIIPPSSSSSSAPRRKRRRTKTAKNQQEIENQRMTHIAVERNRRRQMNDYLAVLRSLMPPSYVQRGDQASIVGGAINFVKELEQLVQSMERQREQHTKPPFADFFAFPQYTRVHVAKEEEKEELSGVADIEVTLVDSHANLKILSEKRPGQLLNIVLALQILRLCILHLNLTTTPNNLVLYSLTLKVEEGCQLNTVDEIASAVNQLLCKIQQEASFS